MPQEMNAAFTTAVLDFVADPDRLDEILAGLEDVRANLYGD
jgi:hypothetical protein